MTTTMNPAAGKAALEHQVADLKLAEWGRKEILLAEQECPASWPCARSTRPRSP